jgi:hypothetical protein
LPAIFGQGWSFLLLQTGLALVLILRWKFYDAL